MTTTRWTNATHDGGLSVLSPKISKAEFDAVTKEQIKAWAPLLRLNLPPQPRTILDYGCGPGRFTERLAWMFSLYTAYDPCSAWSALVPRFVNVRFTDTLPREKFDVVFVWCVAGGLDEAEAQMIAAEIAALLKPKGVLFFADHVSDPPFDNAWRFRAPAYYPILFRAHSIELSPVGTCKQLQNDVTMFVGRFNPQLRIAA